MIKNYIFDFGQVIVRFDPFYMTSQYVKDKDDVALVQKVVFDRLYWDKLDAGTITDEEVKRGICGRLPEHLQKSACKVYENWYRNLPFINGIPELLKDIKCKGGKVYLLSNISIGFAEDYITVPEIKNVLDLFDGFVFSGPIGITKPNKEIFEYLLNKYVLKVEECVFIDDNTNNISGAEKFGLKSILFTGDVNELKFELLKLSK